MRVEDLRVSYGAVEVLHGVSLSVAKGEIVTVLGPNGTGKTTLLRAVCGLLRPRAGRVVFDGVDITRTAAEKLPGRGLFQLPEGRGIFHTLTVGENLALGAYAAGSRAARGDLDRVLQIFPELAERRDVRAANLSGGQQQMLALGRSIMARPRLLVIDELSFGLAPKVVSRLFEVISELRADGLTSLIVEQQAGALRISDRTYVMRSGRNVMDGPSKDILESDELVERYLRS